ncbi:hypothetical protein ACJ73_01541 [Blastomyces percursus]|uniref:Methyltransferase domain-containing protein n=1 Tax=Blastomyces percursus TaxID=1658174 RepID=A0A1J9QEX6_9EURO|nr:hypothetical protein ACJ73_01541 [Blastomyces percursus]
MHVRIVYPRSDNRSSAPFAGGIAHHNDCSVQDRGRPFSVESVPTVESQVDHIVSQVFPENSVDSLFPQMPTKILFKSCIGNAVENACTVIRLLGEIQESDLQPRRGSPDTSSISSTVFNYRNENGRRYHGSNDGAYFLPNDKREQDRMDLLHFIYRHVLDRRLYCAPIKRNPGRVLDLGTGTGNWAVGFSDQHPKSQVIGTDISPVQRIHIPPNCTFEIDDFEVEWPLFDFIHMREIAGSVHYYLKLFGQAHRHLAPGGFLEMKGMETKFFSDDETHERAVTAMQWQQLLVEASRQVGKELGIERGFVDVEEVVFKVPLSPWPQDPRMKELGH